MRVYSYVETRTRELSYDDYASKSKEGLAWLLTDLQYLV